MKRRSFLLGAAGVVGVALGRSMITVPGFPPVASFWQAARIRDIDDPLGFRIGDLIRRANGFLYEVKAIERDGPVGAELLIVDPIVEVSSLDGTRINGQMRIYRHRFEHDGRYFHVGTSKPYDPEVEHPRLETWHPNFWKRAHWDVEPPWDRPREEIKI